jgi:hypothetical protein
MDGSAALIAEARDDSPERSEPRVLVLSTGELAECTCPDFCERDHENE